MGWRDAPIVDSGQTSTPKWMSAPLADDAARMNAIEPGEQPAPQEPGLAERLGLSRDETGQLSIPVGQEARPDIGTQLLPEFLARSLYDTAVGVARPVVGGVRNAAVGVASLPFDIADYFGMDGAGDIAESIQKNVPRIEQRGTMGEIGQTLTQYAAPAGLAAKAVPAAEAGAGLLSQILHGIGKIAAAGTADAVVTDPSQASTIGDLLGAGPTRIDPEDSALAKRAKVGGETLAVQPVVEAASALGRTGKGIYDIRKSKNDPVAHRKMAEDTVGRSALDPEQALADMEMARAAIDPDGGFRPTGPEMTKDVGLLQLQRGVAQDPKMVSRKQKNEENTISKFREATDPLNLTDPTGAPITRAARNQVDEEIAPLRADVEAAKRRAEAVDQDIAWMADDLETKRYGKANASESIANVDAQTRAKVQAEKNKLYDPKEIDPEGALVMDSEDFLARVSDIKPEPGAVDSGIPQKIQAEIDKIRPPEEGVDAKPEPMSFSYLSNLRSSVADAIKTARAANEGARVKSLTRLKDEINAEIETFAGIGDPLAQDAVSRLQGANEYYKTTASPLLREGVGGDLTRAEKTGRPVPPTEVAGKYIGSGPASRERVADFNRMKAQAGNPAQLETDARDWIISDLANFVGGKLTPERVERWMKNPDTAEILNGVPAAKKEIGQMLNRLQAKSGVKKQIENDILAAAEKVAKKEKEIKMDALGSFLETKDPYAEIGSIMNSKGGVRQKMRRVLAAAKKDTTGDAVDGVKDAVRTWMRGKILTSKAATGRSLETGSKKPSFGELDEIINTMNDGNVRDVLEDVYGKGAKEIKNLDRVRTQLEIMSRQERTQGTTNSSTKPLADNARRTDMVLAALVSSNYRQNRILNYISAMMPDSSKAEIDGMIVDIILDPDMTETVLRRQTEESLPEIKKSLRTFITNNLLGDSEEQAKKNNERK